MSIRRYDNDASEDSARFLSDQERAARWDADRYDRTEYTRATGSLRDADDIPHPSDIADLGDYS